MDCAQPTDGETEVQGDSTQTGPQAQGPAEDGLSEGRPPGELHFLGWTLCRAELGMGRAAFSLCPGCSACWGGAGSEWALACVV